MPLHDHECYMMERWNSRMHRIKRRFRRERAPIMHSSSAGVVNVVYIGKRKKELEDYLFYMHADDVKKWTQEYESRVGDVRAGNAPPDAHGPPAAAAAAAARPLGGASSTSVT